MPIQEFRKINFRPDTLKKITLMQEIVADYAGQGLRLTARQLYYQFVSRNVITNEEKSYKNLTGLLADARYAGLIDWDAIEDRGREASVPLEFRDIKHRVTSALANYRLQRWADQDSYVELWVEKQALAGVLEPLASEFHVTLMVNKGYSSASAMFDSAARFIERQEDDKELALLYLGDHDPSGEDMVRDIGDRLHEFGVDDLDVTKVALTMAQVEEYDPPPNPAKKSDSRFAKYEAAHGTESWEVDALPPNVLQQLIRDALEAHLDRERWDAVLQQEKTDKARLTKAAENIMKG